MRPLIVKIAEEHFLETVIIQDASGFLSVVAPYLLPSLPAKDELEVTPLSRVFWRDLVEFRADGVISLRRRDNRDRSVPLIHLEIEHACSPWLGERLQPCREAMERYHECEILTIVLVLHGDRAGLVIEERPFRWMRFGLRGCDAREYLAREEPFAWAIAACMDPGDWSPLRHKQECFQHLETAIGLSRQRKHYLSRWFDIAIPLPREEQDELEMGLAEDHALLSRYW
ncbi:MAG: hypothetical protein GY835_19280 [bacterium]|nr:hypothetical protein [bacterium]